MTQREMTNLIQPWINRGKAVEAIVEDAKRLIGADPESPIIRELYGTFGALTKSTAERIGDQEGWLEWFAWECEFGRKPKEVEFPDGEILMVVGASDLAAAIATDENGNRVWEGGVA